MRFAPLGEEGQRRLLAGRALICGCGALGTVLAETLTRAGVGFLRIVDRDFVELNNLQRQVLFDEQDALSVIPKAVAATEKLRRINSEIEIEPLVADVDQTNIISLCRDVGVILDGTDNFETRFLINDAAIKLNIPWVYGGCLGAEGQTLTILPGETPCLRCLMQDAPPPGTMPTCDTAGVLAPAVNIVASLQALEAIKILSGHREAINRGWTIVDLWENRLRQIQVASLRESGDCPACKRGELAWLEGDRAARSAVLCGRNAVQLSFPDRRRLSLDDLAPRLEGAGTVMRNPFLLRLTVEPYVLTVFADGRAIIGGTDDISVARNLYAKYIGN